MQMICALLIFPSGDLPEPLGHLSPWLDWRGTPRDDLWARLAAQPHRRCIKTHTPLDGIPLDRQATYSVVGRHPLDMAVSLYHQGDNIDRRRQRERTGQPAPSAPPPPRPPLRRWLLSWIDGDPTPDQDLDSLPGVLWHASDAWSRRHERNVVLVHYDDLQADLEAEMRRLAARLEITVPADRWSALVHHASFAAMRARAATTAPDPGALLIDRARFFRRGTSGAGREVLSPDELAHYHDRVQNLASPEVLAWLHHHPATAP